MIEDSLRRGPATEAEWLGPLPVRAWFAHPERRLEIDLGCGKGRFLLARAAKNPEGTGLGLSIAQHIAVRHSIRLHCKSQPGNGACFTFDGKIAQEEVPVH